MRGDRRSVRRGPLRRLAVTVLVVTGLTAGCTGSADDRTEETPAASATPLADIDLTGVVPTRAAFCDDLDAEGVASVLGGEPKRTDSYGSGQRAELAPGLRDVADEYGCSFERGPRLARAWLFARPVSRPLARRLVAERSKDEGCRPGGRLSFGAPGLVQSCTSPTRRRVTAAGLFGDAWLTCEAAAPRSVPEAELLEQTQRWCVDVARSTDRSPAS